MLPTQQARASPGVGLPPSRVSKCQKVASYLGQYRQEGWSLGGMVLTVTSQHLGLRYCLKLFHVWLQMPGSQVRPVHTTHTPERPVLIHPWELPLAKPGLPAEALVQSTLSIQKHLVPLPQGCSLWQPCPL